MLLRQEGIKVSEQQIDGATAFYLAAQNGHTEVVKLLKNGAKINKGVLNGATPLSCCTEWSH